MLEILLTLSISFLGGFITHWSITEPTVVTKLQCPKLDYPVVVEDINGTGCIEVEAGDLCSTAKPRVVLDVDNFLVLTNGLVTRKNDIMLCKELIRLNNEVSE